MDMGGMDMGGGSACKVSMLWNWYTIDACFLAESWHVKNNGIFAVSCIGAALLALLMEALRRAGREYDALLLRRWQTILQSHPGAVRDTSITPMASVSSAAPYVTFRATPLQQLIRAVMHASTLGLAYIIMLLIMYFNGYIFFSILIGAGLGKFLCDWLVVRVPFANTEAGTSNIVLMPQTKDCVDCCSY